MNVPVSPWYPSGRGVASACNCNNRATLLKERPLSCPARIGRPLSLPVAETTTNTAKSHGQRPALACPPMRPVPSYLPQDRRSHGRPMFWPSSHDRSGYALFSAAWWASWPAGRRRAAGRRPAPRRRAGRRKNPLGPPVLAGFIPSPAVICGRVPGVYTTHTKIQFLNVKIGGLPWNPRFNFARG